MTSDRARKSMRANRSRDTRPELAVRSRLHARGLRYRVARRPVPTLRRSADVVFTRAKVAVFIDGCFWHGCPEHFWAPKSNTDYWEPKIRANIARDQETTLALEEAGWRVIRVWEHEDPNRAADRIQSTVLQASALPPRQEKPHYR